MHSIIGNLGVSASQIVHPAVQADVYGWRAGVSTSDIFWKRGERAA